MLPFTTNNGDPFHDTKYSITGSKLPAIFYIQTLACPENWGRVFFFFLTVKQYQNELSFQKQPPEVFCRWHLSVTFSHLFKHILRGYYINRAVSIILIKKEALAKVFSCGFWELFKNTFFHASCFFLFFINTSDFLILQSLEFNKKIIFF